MLIQKSSLSITKKRHFEMHPLKGVGKLANLDRKIKF